MKRVAVFLAILTLVGPNAYATTHHGPASVAINMGTADNFGVLAGSGITNVSAATKIQGDVGSSPTPSVTGITQSQVTGTLYLSADPATAQAQTDLTTAYNDAASAPCGTDLTGVDLGGLTPSRGLLLFLVRAADRYAHFGCPRESDIAVDLSDRQHFDNRFQFQSDGNQHRRQPTGSATAASPYAAPVSEGMQYLLADRLVSDYWHGQQFHGNHDGAYEHHAKWGH